MTMRASLERRLQSVEDRVRDLAVDHYMRVGLAEDARAQGWTPERYHREVAEVVDIYRDLNSQFVDLLRQGIPRRKALERVVTQGGCTWGENSAEAARLNALVDAAAGGLQYP